MPRVYTSTQRLEADALDAFCVLQKGFTDQFVYYDKEVGCHYLGLGRCIAFPSMSDFEYLTMGQEEIAPILFSFNRFDAENPAPADALLTIAVSPALLRFGMITPWAPAHSAERMIAPRLWLSVISSQTITNGSSPSAAARSRIS